MSDRFTLRYFCPCGQQLFKSANCGQAELEIVCPSRHHGHRTSAPRLRPIRIPDDAGERPRARLLTLAS